MYNNIPVTIQPKNHPFPSIKQHCQNVGPQNGTKICLANHTFRDATTQQAVNSNQNPTQTTV